ncbi:uncharacterized protein PAN0_009c3687 [Moesziomyces antarcticus]|uniref:Uncharacterized protein n=2 Tax=Pseudozyma antarctica TaxID=84753 RepID=A0A081CFM4_PSEA2|nr:uncharacterized protein PAN0_009c3687 [Moesziomyces antarcticus]GAK65470.1 conserved hypothetical protein [Moesziomyces antarcticus]SPO46478.1 uncharacterized protein PSANT_04164 [Moesziomyces antarcticus]
MPMSSVNEKLARAREQDLRRARNLQAKLRRTHDGTDPDTVAEPDVPVQNVASGAASSSSRAGLMYLSSTEQAQRERDQRSRETQLKRQVAGPIPPESWRRDFDRLTINRGLFIPGSNDISTTASASSLGAFATKAQRKAIGTVLRSMYDKSRPQPTAAGVSTLFDMTLCVIADAINRPASGHAHDKGKQRQARPEMDIEHMREVLSYLPRRMHQRMLALYGSVAATEWPLADWTAQALTSQMQVEDHPAEGDWDEVGHSPPIDFSAALAPDLDASFTALDLSFSSISTRTLSRLLSLGGGQAGVSLRMLSLAGWNSHAHSAPVPLDSPGLLSVLSQLPNLEVLSVAGSRFFGHAPERTGKVDTQRTAVFLRRLSRSLTKLRVLDLSFCAWVCADAVQGVSWATSDAVAWPRLEHLLLLGCESFVESLDDIANATMPQKPSESYVGAWHATHSQRDMRENPTRQASAARADLFDDAPTPPRIPPRLATFSQLTSNTAKPSIATYIVPPPAAARQQGAIGEVVQCVSCPHSKERIEMWQWQRARVLDAVHGRTSPNARHRNWVDVWF